MMCVRTHVSVTLRNVANIMRIRRASNRGSILVMYTCTYVGTYVSVTLRNVAVTSRRNVANQRSCVIIIARKKGGAWERIIINALQAVDRSEG